MSDAVKRYSERQIADAYTKFRMAIKGNSVPETMDFIAATAYDALEAENVRLRAALERHGKFQTKANHLFEYIKRVGGTGFPAIDEQISEWVATHNVRISGSLAPNDKENGT